ncbi:polymorphic toxin-type HINT domain-containing protein [Streptomyces sp. MBT42]|uniref:polymorphic toxin-type HINT domain-containing protein n=1 Tax=Streptomyces sp. MBT42 TaxID=1488373 RepID=UPI0027E028C8|nr:polymorphic toxin-type HINT domain-containing protein [Streptomyces sp. MBT42]
MNGYTYANGSPVSKSDPTGLRPEGVCGGNSSRCNSDNDGNESVQTYHESWEYKVTGWKYNSFDEDSNGKRTYNKPNGVNWGSVVDLTPRKPVLNWNSIPGLGRSIAAYWTGSPISLLPGSPTLLYDTAAEKLGVDTADPGYEDGESLGDAVSLVFMGVGAAKGATKALTKGPCHSFLPGTEVLMADGTRKKIEEVETGDVVVTTDVETGKNAERKVLETIRTEDDKDFTAITVATGETPSSIVATDTHPFWVPSLKEWVPAGDLSIGDWLRTSAGTLVQITALDRYTKRQRTHDLTIEDIHAYYVLAGATPVLVHNCGGGTTVYRGVSEISGETGELNPAFDDAVEGIARPRGGDSTPELHQQGHTDSDYTSWTTSEAAAIRAATMRGGNGVVLRGTIPTGRFHVHPNDESWGMPHLRTEFEVIIQGEMRGAPRAVWPGAGTG